MIIDNMVHCPHCDCDYTHLKSVELYNETEGEDRMSALLKFNCEGGHTFTMDVRQHEGITFVDFLKGGETDVSE